MKERLLHLRTHGKDGQKIIDTWKPGSPAHSAMFARAAQQTVAVRTLQYQQGMQEHRDRLVALTPSWACKFSERVINTDKAAHTYGYAMLKCSVCGYQKSQSGVLTAGRQGKICPKAPADVAAAANLIAPERRGKDFDSAYKLAKGQTQEARNSRKCARMAALQRARARL